MIEYGAAVAGLVQQRVGAVLAAAVGQGEHIDGGIGQAQGDQRAAAVEQDRGIDRGLVFNMPGGADPAGLSPRVRGNLAKGSRKTRAHCALGPRNCAFRNIS